MANHAAEDTAHTFQADPADPRHGTRHGYTYYRCKCGPCHAADAEYKVRRKARIRANRAPHTTGRENTR